MLDLLDQVDMEKMMNTDVLPPVHTRCKTQRRGDPHVPGSPRKGCRRSWLWGLILRLVTGPERAFQEEVNLKVSLETLVASPL